MCIVISISITLEKTYLHKLSCRFVGCERVARHVCSIQSRWEFFTLVADANVLGKGMNYLRKELVPSVFSRASFCGEKVANPAHKFRLSDEANTVSVERVYHGITCHV